MIYSKRRTRTELLKYNNIIIYGAGDYLPEMLLSIPADKIYTIVDGSPLKIGTTIENKWAIASPDIIKNIGIDTAVVLGMVSHAFEVYTLLTETYGINDNQIFTMQRPFLDAMFQYDILDENIDKVGYVYDLLADDDSKELYCNYMQYVNTMSPKYLKCNPHITDRYCYHISESLYISLSNKKCVLDCGAYVGDTADFFLKTIPNDGEILCVEGFHDNCVAIRDWIKKNNLIDRVSLYEGCVGQTEGIVSMSVGGSINDSALISKVPTDMYTCLEVPMTTIDILSADKKVDYIKFDIEGSEMDALKGGRNTIIANRPQMMVSAYHRLEHLWEIPIYLHKLVPEYKFYFGHQPNAAMEPEFYVSI